jgi:hypothetical protein
MIDLNKYYISSTFQGASGGSEGRSGYVPQPLSADEFKFFRGDGTWSDIIILKEDDQSKWKLIITSGGVLSAVPLLTF